MWTKDNYSISTDRRKLNPKMIQQYLANDSYWAQDIPLEKVKIAIKNSVCFGLYDGKKQIGFCRVVTDYVRFAWLADVFILPAYRGRGLSKWLMQIVFQYPDFQGTRRWMLGTKDAHGLYEQYGFTALEQPERMMHKQEKGPW
jgi:GNAT superfamily N-acetyltransferase